MRVLIYTLQLVRNPIILEHRKKFPANKDTQFDGLWPTGAEVMVAEASPTAVPCFLRSLLVDVSSHGP